MILADPKTREEWLESRRKGIGGSDGGYSDGQAAVIGIHMDNWNEKPITFSDTRVRAICVEQWDNGIPYRLHSDPDNHGGHRAWLQLQELGTDDRHFEHQEVNRAT